MPIDVAVERFGGVVGSRRDSLRGTFVFVVDSYVGLTFLTALTVGAMFVASVGLNHGLSFRFSSLGFLCSRQMGTSTALACRDAPPNFVSAQPIDSLRILEILSLTTHSAHSTARCVIIHVFVVLHDWRQGCHA